MSKIPEDMRKKIKQNTENYLSIKDENGQLVITKDNPFEGRFIKYEYVDEPNDRYANEEGKKHVFTFKYRNDEGELENIQYSTKYWNIASKIAKLDAQGVKDFRMWWTQEGTQTRFNVEPILKDKEERDINYDDIPQDDIVEDKKDDDDDILPPAEGNEDDDAVDVEQIPF